MAGYVFSRHACVFATVRDTLLAVRTALPRSRLPHCLQVRLHWDTSLRAPLPPRCLATPRTSLSFFPLHSLPVHLTSHLWRFTRFHPAFLRLFVTLILRRCIYSHSRSVAIFHFVLTFAFTTVLNFHTWASLPRQRAFLI